MKKFLLAALLLPSLAVANIMDITGDQTAGSLGTPDGATVTFEPSPADLILYGTNADFTNQSPAGLAGDLSAVIGQDLLITSFADGLSGTTITIPLAASVYYLHYGNNALAFGYDAPVPQSFTISDLPHDISNYRLYALDIVGDVTSATAPGHLALLSLGLLGLFKARRLQG